MPTFKLILAYDGTSFAGWQAQQDQRTVQGTLEATLAKIIGQPLRVMASGRTDAGVHALGQVVSFRAETHLSAEVLARALNAELPDDMAVNALVAMPGDFHALRDAVRKRYRYVLHDGPVPNLFRRLYAWHYRQPLNAEAMSAAARCLLGRHDFSSFESAGSPRQSSVRTMLDCLVLRLPNPDQHLIHIELEADGFLYNMVRSIVGTLVDIGRGAQPPEHLDRVLTARDRTAAGITAPPHGLFLVRVDYEESRAGQGGAPNAS